MQRIDGGDRPPIIKPTQLPALLLRACPSFEAVWAEIEREHEDDESPGGRLHYLDAGDFIRHVAGLEVVGERQQFPAVFQLVERLITEGDGYVSELGVIGYLEGLQMSSVTSLAIDPEQAFRPLVGPESKKWWARINAFWSGDHGAIQVED